MLSAITYDRNIREAEREYITGVPKSTWWRYEQEGKAPKRKTLFDGGRGVAWSFLEIMLWCDGRWSAEQRDTNQPPLIYGETVNDHEPESRALTVMPLKAIAAEQAGPETAHSAISCTMNATRKSTRRATTVSSGGGGASHNRRGRAASGASPALLKDSSAASLARFLASAPARRS